MTIRPLAPWIRTVASRGRFVYATGMGLTVKMEAFALGVVELGSKAEAYRRAYDAENCSPATVWTHAVTLANDPRVERRIDELRAAAATHVLATVQALVTDWIDIATADPNELVKRVHRCCRNCHGDEFGHQWRNEDEYMTAVAVAIDAQKPSPDGSGGFGFDGFREPHPACPVCYGDGIQSTIIADTTKLSRKALKLYAGIKETSTGVEIKMHDQQKARESLARVLGAFNDKLDLRTPEQRKAAEMPADITTDAAAKAYQRMLN